MKKFLLFFTCLLLITVFMTSCGAKKVQKTINGFEVTILHDEPGDLAKEGDYAYFRYEVKSKDSTLFSSSSQTPMIKFKLPKVEKQDPKNAQPLLEALFLMSKGDSALVEQMLTEEMKTQIGINNVDKLSFYISLVDIKSEADYNADMQASQQAAAENAKMISEKVTTILNDYTSGTLASSIKTTPSGLKYIVHEEGTGALPETGKPVSVNYYGTLMDGNRFDDSWSRGQAFQFILGQGQVIKGWDEGVALLKKGSKASLFIPAELAYGAEGSPPAIPANSELMFYIELMDAN